MEKATKNKVQIHLPTDFVTADKFAADAVVGETSVEAGIPDGSMVRTVRGTCRTWFTNMQR